MADADAPPPRRWPAGLYTRLRLRLTSAIQTSRLVSEAMALAWWAGRRVAPPGTGPSPALLRVMRLTQRPALRQRLRREFGAQLAPAASARVRASGARSAEPLRLPATLLLKAPGSDGEKGVLFLANEGQFDLVLARGRYEELAAQHHCVVASAWSPPAYHKFIQVAHTGGDPLFVGISNEDDIAGLSVLEPWLRPVPLLSADWLNPDDFNPLPRAQRDIDIVMVAGWGAYKRHWLLFEALRRLPRDLRVVLVGANNAGRTVRDVQAEAHAFGVRQEVEFHTALPVQQVYALQCRARIALQLSSREGSCVAVTEAFFADTPVGMMADAHVGTKRHINPRTGVLLRRRGLATQVAAMLERADDFTPREWAASRISYRQSCATLNELLRAHALASGQPWTRDIAPFYRRYFTPWYADAEQGRALCGARDAVLQQHGIQLHAGGL